MTNQEMKKVYVCGINDGELLFIVEGAKNKEEAQFQIMEADNRLTQDDFDSQLYIEEVEIVFIKINEK